MQWTDTSILLSIRKYGENSALVRLLSREHGVYGGVVRGAHSKNNRGVLQPGNIVNATWNARLSEQLGAFKIELLEANAAHIMQDSARLNALSAACTIIESALPERHPYPNLYKIFQGFLNVLREDGSWWEAYVRLELAILAESGFGLDLSECAATGTMENLVYVSPKSGRAVSAQAGEPYRDRLLALPNFLQGIYKKNRADTAEILAGLRLTGYFLEHWLLTPHNRKLPAVRARLIQTMKNILYEKV